jgi:hypothetical protein
MSIFHFYSLFTPVQAHFDQSTHQIGPSRSRDPVPGTKPRRRAGNRGGEKALPSLLPMAAGRIGPAALLLLLLGVSCPGARAGRTSEYRRKLGSAIDMPLDADVFRPPPGHNAPEQVTNPSYAQGTVSSFPGRRLRLVAHWSSQGSVNKAQARRAPSVSPVCGILDSEESVFCSSPCG